MAKVFDTGTDYVIIYIDAKKYQDLTPEQKQRMQWKMHVVSRVAQRSFDAMVKGTLKYEEDAKTLDEWIEHGFDDAVDVANYMGIIEEHRDAYNRLRLC